MAGAFDPLAPLSDDDREAVVHEQRRVRRRLFGFRLVTVLAFLLLSVRLWEMQILQTQSYATRAEENRVRTRTVKALRGVIYDRNGQQLAFNRPSFDVAVDPQDLPEAQQHAVVDRLAKLLKADANDLNGKIDTQRHDAPNAPVTVASSIPREVLLTVKEEHMNLPGVITLQNTIREYVDGNLLSGIDGYVGPIAEDAFPDLKNDGYEKDDKVGKAGVELTYEDDLRGTNGMQHVEVDAGGREVQVIDQIDPRVGNSLQLTIDQSLQKDVSSYLRWGLDRAHCYLASPDEKVFTANCPQDAKDRIAKPVSEGGRGDEGAALVMNVHTGEILSMVAFPQYDNNAFSGLQADRAKVADVLTRKDNPLINRALSATAPGSTFKMITASGALQDHVVTPTTGISVGACWAQNIMCNWEARSYANMTVVDAIAQSNDIWMGAVVAGLGPIRGLQADRLAFYGQQFGLGKPLGIDLPFEQKGLTPTTAWKQANFEGDEATWHTGELLNMAIGQGADLATPLQMLSAAAAVANGGKVMVPHVAKAVLDSSGRVVRTIDPVVKNQMAVDADTLRIVAAGMRKGVYTGSSYKTNLRDLKIAGKTGTAEFAVIGPDGKPERDKDGHLPTHAWWVGFAPYDNPEIAVAVFINDAGEGADFAAPVARKIFARYFHVSDERNYYGCDTPQTTAPACSFKWSGWFDASFSTSSPAKEDASDAHDPTFASAAPSPTPSPPTVTPRANGATAAPPSPPPSPRSGAPPAAPGAPASPAKQQ